MKMDQKNWHRKEAAMPASTRPTLEFVGSDVLIMIDKGLLVLTRAQLIAALRRGKAWRRREARQRREGNTT
jgi:hypothetical protein